MKDLTPAFKSAVEIYKKERPRNDMHALLSMLSSALHESGYIDWDDGVFENWGRILVRSKVALLVSVLFPLYIVHTNYLKDVQGIIEDDKGIIVELDDFDDTAYCIDKSLLEEIFQTTMTDCINYHCLSINDLWYATVT